MDILRHVHCAVSRFTSPSSFLLLYSRRQRGGHRCRRDIRNGRRRRLCRRHWRRAYRQKRIRQRQRCGRGRPARHVGPCFMLHAAAGQQRTAPSPCCLSAQSVQVPRAARPAGPSPSTPGRFPITVRLMPTARRRQVQHTNGKVLEAAFLGVQPVQGAGLSQGCRGRQKCTCAEPLDALRR